MRKPISSRTTFKIIVIVDSGSGTKFDSTMPRPEMLLTEVWLGTRKKYTAAAMIATAAVRIAASFKTSAALSFLFICVVPPNRNLLHYSKPGLQTQSPPDGPEAKETGGSRKRGARLFRKARELCGGRGKGSDSCVPRCNRARFDSAISAPG